MRIAGIPSGLRCWPSSVVLMHLLAQSNLVRDKVVLELGAGTGLAGLSACLVGGARRTVLSDCERLVLRLLKHNIELNQCEAATVRRLDWGSQVDIEEVLEEEEQGFDVLLASENTYCAEAIRSFWRAAATLLRDNGTVLLAREIRMHTLESAILDGGTQAGFIMQEIPLADFMPDVSTSTVPQTWRGAGGFSGSNRPEAPGPCEWPRYRLHMCIKQSQSCLRSPQVC